MRYYLIVGEASGDLHASNLMKALKAEDSQAEFRFYGGDLMRSVGGTLVKHYKEMAYMGFVPVMLHLRTILTNMKQCKQDVLAWNPDVFENTFAARPVGAISTTRRWCPIIVLTSELMIDVLPVPA